ncbi:MAG: hypothetical protein GY820_22785 [Gammaproteobacteria bacterium]|nr:hypothetical protein [Gammaproteobacteria bacterium]
MISDFVVVHAKGECEHILSRLDTDLCGTPFAPRFCQHLGRNSSNCNASRYFPSNGNGDSYGVIK